MSYVHLFFLIACLFLLPINFYSAPAWVIIINLAAVFFNAMALYTRWRAEN